MPQCSSAVRPTNGLYLTFYLATTLKSAPLILLSIKMLKCFQVGTDGDGKILNMKGNIYENGGSHCNEHAFPFTEAHLKNCYDSSTWNVKISDVQTDLPTNIYCRAPGTFHAMRACGEILCSVDRASRYIRLKKNQLGAQFIFCIFRQTPLYVSGISIAYHQEVHSMDKTVGTYCSL